MKDRIKSNKIQRIANVSFKGFPAYCLLWQVVTERETEKTGEKSNVKATQQSTTLFYHRFSFVYSNHPVHSLDFLEMLSFRTIRKQFSLRALLVNIPDVLGENRAEDVFSQFSSVFNNFDDLRSVPSNF